MADKPHAAVELPPTDIRPRADEPISTSKPAELPLFSFGLRQLFWFVAVASTLMTAIVSVQGLTAVALLLAALVVVVHVLSTAIGSRLRAHANRELTSGPHDDAVDAARSAARSAVAAIQNSGRSPWHGRGSTVLPWLPRLIVAGVFLGGIVGGIFLTATIGHRTSPASILVGSASSAVLGGWFAFLGGSFYGIFRHGVREALSEQRKDESRQQACK
jgi:Na+-transporting methylmalonyl-CoA/oxaloacetate decarboxylase gamma subunit